MRVLLISTYELGHQPLHVASPAAALQAAGHDVRCLDLSVQKLNPADVDWAHAVAFSVPMHTAMRLALRGAELVRARRPGMPVCLYGLYAPMSRDQTVGRIADRVIAGEYETGLVEWAGEVAGLRAPAAEMPPVVQLGHDAFRRPARDLLPPLSKYAHLQVGDEERLAGYVEASHGCAHTCRHCPVPVVYGGRIRLVPQRVVVKDVAQQVEAGARHITFGDPDFLNGWRHSLRVVEAVHEAFPDVTFDCTTKVEHILRHADVWPAMARAGCLFVVSAFECVNDVILQRLDKGHTTAEADRAVEILRSCGIEVRPSWMPFTPWTTPRDVADILDFVATRDLVGNVDPVQYSIRLLLPEGSLLLDHPDVSEHVSGYDAERLTYVWRAADPASDELQAELARLVEEATSDRDPILDTYVRIRAVVASFAGEREAIPVGATAGRPRLTEPWFC